DQLASALSSQNGTLRDEAERAMRGIGHVNTPYSFWFSNGSTFQRRLQDLFFIGFQERLDEDFELLKDKLGLLEDVGLPGDETGTLPAPVVVEDQHAGGCEARIEVHELVLRGRVPVGIEAEQCDLVRRMLRNRLLDRALDEMNPFLRIADAEDRLANVIDRRV